MSAHLAPARLRFVEKKTVSVSLRLTQSQKEGLAELTGQTKLNQATLIDIAIDGLLEYAKHHKGRLMLPLDFTTVWRELKEIEAVIDADEAADK